MQVVIGGGVGRLGLPAILLASASPLAESVRNLHLGTP
jgi:hypothetical protein